MSDAYVDEIFIDLTDVSASCDRNNVAAAGERHNKNAQLPSKNLDHAMC